MFLPCYFFNVWFENIVAHCKQFTGSAQLSFYQLFRVMHCLELGLRVGYKDTQLQPQLVKILLISVFSVFPWRFLFPSFSNVSLAHPVIVNGFHSWYVSSSGLLTKCKMIQQIVKLCLCQPQNNIALLFTPWTCPLPKCTTKMPLWTALMTKRWPR